MWEGCTIISGSDAKIARLSNTVCHQQFVTYFVISNWNQPFPSAKHTTQASLIKYIIFNLLQKVDLVFLLWHILCVPLRYFVSALSLLPSLPPKFPPECPVAHLPVQLPTTSSHHRHLRDVSAQSCPDGVLMWVKRSNASSITREWVVHYRGSRSRENENFESTRYPREKESEREK